MITVENNRELVFLRALPQTLLTESVRNSPLKTSVIESVVSSTNSRLGGGEFRKLGTWQSQRLIQNKSS